MNKSFKNKATELQQRFVNENEIKFEAYCILKDEDAIKCQLFPWESIVRIPFKLTTKFRSKLTTSFAGEKCWSKSVVGG